jgi:hypothetical protein
MKLVKLNENAAPANVLDEDLFSFFNLKSTVVRTGVIKGLI